mmetsp:Transcript_22640/g.58978  ORF Transcript_22640/g.58978 Transcript_22640/m.58978 type:complete len:269 (-) Transcript_22640:9-815(-)
MPGDGRGQLAEDSSVVLAAARAVLRLPVKVLVMLDPFFVLVVPGHIPASNSPYSPGKIELAPGHANAKVALPIRLDVHTQSFSKRFIIDSDVRIGAIPSVELVPHRPTIVVFSDHLLVRPAGNRGHIHAFAERRVTIRFLRREDVPRFRDLSGFSLRCPVEQILRVLPVLARVVAEWILQFVALLGEHRLARSHVKKEIWERPSVLVNLSEERPILVKAAIVALDWPQCSSANSDHKHGGLISPLMPPAAGHRTRNGAAFSSACLLQC